MLRKATIVSFQTSPAAAKRRSYPRLWPEELKQRQLFFAHVRFGSKSHDSVGYHLHVS